MDRFLLADAPGHCADTKKEGFVPKTKLLIVEDYEGIVTLLRSTLDDEFELVVARDAAEGLNAVREHKPHVVLLDLGLPPKSSPEEGLRFLRELKQAGGHHKTIVCTGYSERSLAVRAIGYGARDVLYKPLDLVLLKSILRRSGWIAELEMEAQQSFGALPATADAFEQMIGTCPAIIRICDVVKHIGPTEASVLVTGENGTGKELTARAIHERSLRRTGPFVTVDCGILPEALLDAELFGFSQQSVPDAAIKSKLESARGGTLFLKTCAGFLRARKQNFFVCSMSRLTRKGCGDDRRRSMSESSHQRLQISMSWCKRVVSGRISPVVLPPCGCTYRHCASGEKISFSWRSSFCDKLPPYTRNGYMV